MIQVKKHLVAAGFMISLFAIACNKNNRRETIPDNVSNAVILQWNEVTFNALGGSAKWSRVNGQWAMVNNRLTTPHSPSVLTFQKFQTF